jgi:hypothetical protein
MKYGTYRGKDVCHFPVVLTRERSDAIGRVAAKRGESKQLVIQRFISLGLLVQGEDDL